MIKTLISMGQLKRKGKWDLNSEFYKEKNDPKKKSSNAISAPSSQADPSFLLRKKPNKPLQDINENSGCGVGTYQVPTEFPLEAKMLTPSYALEPASPSSEIDSASAASQAS